MVYTNTFDDKIMQYRGENWEEFVSLFTDEELEQMRQTRTIYYSDRCTKDTESLLIAYLEGWAVENIKERTISGTEQLLRLLYAFDS